MRTLITLACVALAAQLAACSEKPQVQGARKVGTAASTGTGSKYMAAGWKAGDQIGWDEQMRSRAQYGQNEYSRSTAR